MPTADATTGKQQWLKKAPREWLNCRLYGHAWEPTHDGFKMDNNTNHGAVLTQEVKCLRCETVRTDTFDGHFDRTTSATYRYPDGYSIVGDALSRQEARQYYQLSIQGEQQARRGHLRVAR